VSGILRKIIGKFSQVQIVSLNARVASRYLELAIPMSWDNDVAGEEKRKGGE